MDLTRRYSLKSMDISLLLPLLLLLLFLLPKCLLTILVLVID